MSTRGRKAQPVSVLKMKGTFRQHRHSGGAELEAKLSHVAPEPPSHLSDDDKAEWKRTAEQLAGLGLCTKLDGLALEMLVTSYRGFREATAMLEEQGPLLECATSSGALKPNPVLKVLDLRLATLKWCLTQFGMTPSSRSSLNLGARQEAEDDEEAVARVCGF